jgi:predicted nucleic acid-binding Zn ribbon protein
VTRSRGWRDPAERSAEPAALRDVVAGLLARGPFAAGVPLGRLALRWEDVVGERLAGATAPVALEGGTLVVAASAGPWGAQAQFLSEEIRRRAVEVLGDVPIDRVSVVVDGDAAGGRKPL